MRGTEFLHLGAKKVDTVTGNFHGFFPIIASVVALATILLDMATFTFITSKE